MGPQPGVQLETVPVALLCNFTDYRCCFAADVACSKTCINCILQMLLDLKVSWRSNASSQIWKEYVGTC